jgi:hypothetical protein
MGAPAPSTHNPKTTPVKPLTRRLAAGSGFYAAVVGDD